MLHSWCDMVCNLFLKMMTEVLFRSKKITILVTLHIGYLSNYQYLNDIAIGIYILIQIELTKEVKND